MAQPMKVAMQAQTLEPEKVTSTQEPLEAGIDTLGFGPSAHIGFQAQASIPAALDQPAKVVLTAKSKQARTEFPQGTSLRFDISSVPRCKDISASRRIKTETNKDDELTMVRSVSWRLPPGLGVEVDDDEQLPLGRSKSLPVAGVRLPDGLPSRGSTLHDVGGCQPCAWFWKPGGCKNDQECSRCHACPEGELKLRRRAKKTMLRLGYVTPVTNTNMQETPVSNFIPEPLKTTSVMTEAEATSSSGSEMESPAAGSCMEADAAGSGAPFTPQRVPKWPGAPLGLCGLTATPVSESGTLSTGLDADHEEDEDELPMVQTNSLHAPPGLEPPKAADSNLALLHEMGACQPCAWFWKPSGCQNGKDCMRCHLCPEGELRSRKKVKRTLMRLGLMTPKAKAEYLMAATGAFALPIA